MIFLKVLLGVHWFLFYLSRTLDSIDFPSMLFLVHRSKVISNQQISTVHKQAEELAEILRHYVEWRLFPYYHNVSSGVRKRKGKKQASRRHVASNCLASLIARAPAHFRGVC